ncbi:MAG: aminotransferase class V-fold PLP-dependent enzyme [Puniceicoccaceae bacterium]
MATPKTLPATDIERIRAEFPILSREVNGKPLVYLDNAATAQKPRVMLERLEQFYAEENANIHRGVHALSQRATESYEDARGSVARFIGAAAKEEIVFTRNATESVNLLATSLSHSVLGKDDTVLITTMEHHANIVPWQLLRDRIGIRLATVEVDEDGHLDIEDYHKKLVDLKPALVSMVHVSNSLGWINPAREMIAAAHRENIPVLLDAAQSIPHFQVDVQALDCDWMVFSGHKVFGPSGTGVLFGKSERLGDLPPYQGGGDMIESVSFDKTIYKGIPERFEAGTPNIAGAIALASTLDYLSSLDRVRLIEHEDALRDAATEGLKQIPGLRIVGDGPDKASVVSFVLEAAHPHDIASFLDADGIAIRSGHHCTQPLMSRLGLTGTARASFAFYNTQEEVDALVNGVAKIRDFFA